MLTSCRRQRADQLIGWGVQASPQPCGLRSYEARRMEIRARTPRPRSAAAARMGRETPPVSGRLCFIFAEALAVGLAVAVAVALADGLMVVASGDAVVISPSSDTVMVAVMSGWTSQKYE